MKRQPDGSFLYSPKDLITFLQGDFAAWMDRMNASAAADGRPFPYQPDEDAPEDELARHLGQEHEAAVLAALRERHGDCVAIARDDAAAEPRTLEAMRRGCALIYQGRLGAGSWHGYPDFLIKDGAPSRLGSWSYRPADAKLARNPKPYFLVQLCAYAEYLEVVQGARPARLGFIFGNEVERSFETDRSFYFYRHLKDAFDRFQRTLDTAQPPDPALEADFGRWEGAAIALLEQRDDLRLVARITRSQIKRLRDRGIRTMTQLARSDGAVPRVGAETLSRLRRQARLQLASAGCDLPAFEVIPPPGGKRVGLAALPPASAGDVFLDLEGFPFAEEGLEYLFGALTAQDGATAYHDWWAHDAAEEKAAFEAAVDWLHARWRSDPAMHIYHYANYEVSALRRLMGKYATREDEVDDLLRHNVFVDLLAVTRAGVAIGTRGYSLKDIEVLFSPPRSAGVTDAGGSVVAYHHWMLSGQPREWARSPILSSIRDYNREDCASTWRLASWLRGLQQSGGIAYLPIEEHEGRRPPAAPTPQDLLAAELLQRAQAEGPERRRITELVAYLLNYHRREAKPYWWRYFDRKAASAEDLFDDRECLAGLTRTDRPPRPEQRSLAVEYRFDPDQETKLKREDRVFMISDMYEDGVAAAEILTLDQEAGRLALKIGPSKAIPDTCHLMPGEPFGDQGLRAAVSRFAERWAAGDLTGSQAIDDLLHRRVPRRLSGATGPLLPAAARLPDDLTALVRDLDRTTLCVQGPPGSGKTRNAAAVIVELAASGRRVGVASNSHKAIINLLRAVSERARALGRAVTVVKAGGEDEMDPQDRGHMRWCASNRIEGELARPGVVVGATAYAFAHPELEQRLDYLFVDEAGQVPLANTVAMGLAARNLILVGDQMQLAQPLQGSHPAESGLSCLHYYLREYRIVPPERGVLLDVTWRLHPEICRFISDTAYEGRLQPGPETARRRVVPCAGARLLRRCTGIVLEELDHEGNTDRSVEEAERVAALVAELRRSRVEEEGATRPFDVARDLLIVAPYNAQVRCIQDRLHDPAVRVASVDKFQGQEATVVIVSMCASSLEETPRGPQFLLNPNRLNVALSRARCLAIVVASSRLVRTRPNTVAELELLNLYCRLRSYALESGSAAA